MSAVGTRSGDLISAIGSTPLVELPRLRDAGGARLYAKLEMVNPTGSVKDRVARSLIEAAESEGLLSPGQVVLEPTSGNTGISLAMICRVRGYRMRAVLPESATPERADSLRMYGAEIVWSPGELGSNGAVALARELAAADPDVYMPFQYANPANPRRARPHHRAGDHRGPRRPCRRLRRRARHGGHADGQRPALREANPA